MTTLRVYLLCSLLFWGSLGVKNAAAQFSEIQQQPNYKALQKLSDSLSIYPQWMQTAPYLYYTQGEGDNLRLFVVEAQTGTVSEPIGDYVRFCADYSALLGDSITRADLSFYRMDRVKSKRARSHLFQWYKGEWVVEYNPHTGEFSKSKNKEAEEAKPLGASTYTTDSVFEAVAIGPNVYIRNCETGRLFQMTEDGGDTFDYVLKYGNDTIPKGYWQGHTYVLPAQSDKGVEEMGFIRSRCQGRPAVVTFKMPIPGDENVRQYSLRVLNADRPEVPSPSVDKFLDQVLSVSSYESDEELYFIRINRVGDKIELCRINFADNSLDVVIQEDCSPHYNRTLFEYKIIRGGKQILWWSERSGYGAYYLYNRNGKLLRNVTGNGTLVAGHIVALNEQTGRMIMEGYGGDPHNDPSYRNYYTVWLDKGKPVRIGSSGGYHSLLLSANKQWGILTSSTTSSPPTYAVVNLNTPSKEIPFYQVDPTVLAQSGWKAPQTISIKAADGVTPLYALLYRPFNFDPNKKYPLISYVYPGPQTDLFPLEFTIDDNENQRLADCGFMVLQVSVRGSNPYRGRAFGTFGYGNLRDYPLADSKLAIETVAKQYPQVDLSRVGIYGHSGGAFQTVTSMLTYPDFYKVGIAASGNYDNNIYIQWWAETYHGVSQVQDSVTGQTSFICNVPTPMELAHHLKGHLLLMVGDEDKNVPPSCTYRMANALIQAGKHFDMLVLPGKTHNVFCPYYYARVRDYFSEHLLGKPRTTINILSPTP